MQRPKAKNAGRTFAYLLRQEKMATSTVRKPRGDLPQEGFPSIGIFEGTRLPV